MLRVTLRISLLAIAFAILVPALASAQSPTAVLRDFGMLGTWATDCSRPSNSDNFYTIYASMSDGRVKRTYYNTPGRERPYNEYYITRAIRLPADQLSYQQEGSVNRDKIDVILLKDGNKYKICFLVSAEGNVLGQGGELRRSWEDS